jgi:hypothetical protein
MLKGILTIFFFLTCLVPALAGHGTARGLRCLDCHTSLPFNNRDIVFYDDTYRICLSCHKSYHGSESGFAHPSRIVPSMSVPADMPLDSRGRITCITCHTFHSGYYGDGKGKRVLYLRRVKGKTLCYSCHTKPLGTGR